MNCPNCQHENPDDARFCGECGAGVAKEITCASCGRSSPGDQKFCHGCGARLGEAATQPERDPRAYTPKHLADKILQSKSALEGERKQVTVLFADVQGSTALAEQVDPEDWHTILDRFFTILTEGVHRFEGTVNQYTGDGIMALFGAPIAHEDHAQRACYAALHLRDNLRRYADEVRLAHGLTFSTRIGLNSGEVVVGSIGDDLRMDYTAQGSVVHLAQRMEQLAESGRIYLTQHTASRVPGYFAFRDLGPTPIKGAREPIGVYELEKTGEHQSRFDVSQARGLTKFVGREREMAQLEAAFERARTGKLQLVGIVAEAGTGKSRLLHEFAERCRSRTTRFYLGSCPPHGRTTPLAFQFSSMRSYLGVLEQDSAETARAKISARLSEWGLDADLPFLFEFLDIPLPGATDLGLNAESRQHAFLQVVSHINERNLDSDEVEVGLMEDMHWIDPASEAVYLATNRLDLNLPVINVMTFRPEYRPRQASWPNYEEIRLRPLTEESTAELLTSLLGPEASGCGLETLVAARAAGNPFFVEEIVQSLAESGCLEGTRGAYRVTRKVDAIDVPDSVHSVLSARIDRLASRAKSVLQVAAVIGLEFPSPLVEAAAAIDVGELDTVLHELAQAEFIFQTSAYPEVEFAFKHPLTQQVAYETQLRDTRRRTHGNVARLLEHRYADRLGEKAALIARHWEQGGDGATAARWQARAGEWIGRNDTVQGVRHMQRVLELTKATDASEERDALRLEACRTILNVGGWSIGLTQDAMDAILTEGLLLATRAGDVSRLIDLHVGHGIAKGFAGDIKAYLDAARTAAELIDDSVNRDSVANVLVASGYSSFCLGRLADALDFGKQARELAEGDPTIGIQNIGLSTWGWSLWIQARACTGLGRLDEARALSREGLALTRRHDMRQPLIWTLALSSEIADWSGHVRPAPEAEEARQYAIEATAIAEQHGGNFMHVFTSGALGIVHLLHENWSEGAEALEETLDAARTQRNGLEREAATLAYLARAYLGLGDARRARVTAEQAIACALRQETRLFECQGQLVLAQALRVDAGASAHREIEACLARADTLVEETGGRALAPQIIEERARLAALRGDDEASGSELRQAHALYLEIGATGHAARLAKESKL